MTTSVDIANRSLIALGIQKKISSLSQDSVEAQAANAVIFELRDDLLRMAPWDCALKTANLTYITSTPGTPENTSAQTTLWEPGQPAPPWGYEYQYPVDCLRACWIIPATQTGFSGGLPITTAVTGGAASFWRGPPVRFQVQTDTFYPVTAAALVAGGTGNAVGDILTLATTIQGNQPIGAPAQLQVSSVSTGGVITGVTVVNQLNGAATPAGGSYFAIQPNPVGVSATTGLGNNLATFNLTQGPASPQRVVLTNQEFATLVYVRQVLDPNVMDTLFIRAWINVLAANLCMVLPGDYKNKLQQANTLVAVANTAITAARAVDGNEGLTINDITPDWIRIRGIDGFGTEGWGPYTGMDWGGLWAGY